VTAGSVCLTALPVWQVARLNLFANPTQVAGGTVLVMPSFDPQPTLELLTREGDPVTHFCGVPAHYQFMQALAGFGTARPRPFVAGVGGSPVPAALVESWAERSNTAHDLRDQRGRINGDDEPAGPASHHAGRRRRADVASALPRDQRRPGLRA
jgi:AMP-binding enzyme